MASFVGMDIGQGNCKIAVRERQGLRIVSARMPENIIQDGEVAAPETMVSFLRDLRRSNGIRTRNAALSLAEGQAFFRHVTLPPMSAQEVALNLPYEFRDFVSEDLGEFVYDYAVDQMVEAEDGSLQSMELYAAAVQRKIVTGLRQVFSRAGFRLKVVIPSPMGYSRLIRAHAEQDAAIAERDMVFVDLGQTGVTVSLYHGPNFEAHRNIEFGCSLLDDAIADLKGIDPYTASSYKATNFEGVLDDERCQDIYERFAVEVNRVVNFYNFNNRDKEIESLYFLGGGALIPQLTRAIAETCTLPAAGIEELLPQEAHADAQSAAGALALAALLEGEAM